MFWWRPISGKGWTLIQCSVFTNWHPFHQIWSNNLVIVWVKWRLFVHINMSLLLLIAEQRNDNWACDPLGEIPLLLLMFLSCLFRFWLPLLLHLNSNSICKERHCCIILWRMIFSRYSEDFTSYHSHRSKWVKRAHLQPPWKEQSCDD